MKVVNKSLHHRAQSACVHDSTTCSLASSSPHSVFYSLSSAKIFLSPTELFHLCSDRLQPYANRHGLTLRSRELRLATRAPSSRSRALEGLTRAIAPTARLALTRPEFGLLSLQTLAALVALQSTWLRSQLAASLPLLSAWQLFVIASVQVQLEAPLSSTRVPLSARSGPHTPFRALPRTLSM